MVFLVCALICQHWLVGNMTVLPEGTFLNVRYNPNTSDTCKTFVFIKNLVLGINPALGISPLERLWDCWCCLQYTYPVVKCFINCLSSIKYVICYLHASISSCSSVCPIKSCILLLKYLMPLLEDCIARHWMKVVLKETLVQDCLHNVHISKFKI